LRNIFIFSILTLLLISCGPDDVDDPEPEPEVIISLQTDPFPLSVLGQAIIWNKCEAFPDMASKAECSDISVPINWQDTDSRKITLRVKRQLAQGNATKQLYILQGGPGSPGTVSLDWFIKPFSEIFPDTDLYIIDHRGTEFSSYLTSTYDPDMQTMVEKIKIENPDLEQFNTTNAAVDIGYIAEMLKEADKNIFIYGVSYGTYLAHRYAQIFPDQSKGIILDSVLPSTGHYLPNTDKNLESVVERVLKLCSEDTFCRSKLGDDPVSKALEILEGLKDAECGLSYNETRTTLETFVDNYYSLQLIPSLLYRINRCNDSDKEIVSFFLNLIYSQDKTKQFKNSSTLFYNIMLSEQWDPSLPREDYKIYAEKGFVNLYSDVYELHKFWPLYKKDQYVHGWASENVNILMMNGTLDTRTTIEAARIARDNLTGDNQYFVEIPYGEHGVAFGSPQKEENLPACGLEIMKSYIKNPDVAPDTSCLNNLKSLDFENPEAFKTMTSVDDAWNWNTIFTEEEVANHRAKVMCSQIFSCDEGITLREEFENSEEKCVKDQSAKSLKCKVELSKEYECQKCLLRLSCEKAFNEERCEIMCNPEYLCIKD